MKKKLTDFIQNKLIHPVMAQLKQGTTPEKLSLSCGLGLALTLFPIFGTTVAITVAIGALIRLNIPAMLAINYLLTPLQLIAIPASIYMGESLFGLTHITYNPLQMKDELFQSPMVFMSQYGLAALAGILIWVIYAPLLIYIVYRFSLPLFKRKALLK